jgi:hypothetical protein
LIGWVKLFFTHMKVGQLKSWPMVTQSQLVIVAINGFGLWAVEDAYIHVDYMTAPILTAPNQFPTINITTKMLFK